MTKGNDILIYTDGVAVAGSRSCDIVRRCEAVEISSPDSGSAKEYIPGRTDWSVTVSWLVRSAKSSLMKVGQVVTVEIIDRVTREKLRGTAIITECRITATRGNLAQGSFTFKGSGELKEV